MALQPLLIKLLIVKRSEFRRQATQRPDQPKLGVVNVGGIPEPHLLRKRETTLDLALHLVERITRREEVRVQIATAISCKLKVADIVCGLEGPAQQIADSLDMSRPGEDLNCEVVIGPGLEAVQSAFLDQIIPELAEAKPGLVVAETRTGDCTKPFQMGARTVAEAALEAQTDRSADDQGKQVEVRKECSRPEFG